MTTLPRTAGPSRVAFLAALLSSALASAATVTWDGGGTPNTGGSWQTGTNWSGDAKPLAGDTAALGDVTSGTRTVTLDGVESITQLSMTQNTGGATNALTVNNTLTLTGATPFALTAGAGAAALQVNIAGGSTLAASSANPGMNPAAGTFSLGAGSVLSFTASNTSYDPAVNVGAALAATGGGAQARFISARWFSGPLQFTGPVSVTGSGSSLDLYFGNFTTNQGANQGTVFSGGGTSVSVGAGAALNVWAAASHTFSTPVSIGAGGVLTLNKTSTGTGGNTYATFNGLTLAAGSGTKVAVLSNAATGTTANPVSLGGTVSLGSGSVFQLDSSSNAASLVFAVGGTGVVTQDAATVNLNWSAGGNGNGTRNFSNAGSWTLQNGAQFTFTSTTGRPTGFGFGNMAGCTNAGTLKVLSSSVLPFSDLTNSGTLEAGNGAVLGTAQFANTTNQTPRLVNASGGTVNVSGSGAVLGGSSAYYTGNAGSQLNLASGTSLTLRHITGGQAYFVNAGTVVQDNATLTIDWNDGTNNTVASRFTNSGTWTLQNGAAFRFTRLGNPYFGGFGAGTGNTNSGTLNLFSGSAIDFPDLTNTGTLTLGSASGTVTLATASLNYQNPKLHNSTNGAIVVNGNATLGPSNETESVTLNNGYTGSAATTGASLTVGNGSNAPVFTLMSGGSTTLESFAGNSVTVNAGATLALKTYDDGAPHAFNNRNALWYNRGTATLAGKVQFAGNHAGSNLLDNFGTFTVSGPGAVYERLPNASSFYAAGTNDSRFVNEAGATLGGAGTLTYTNSTGNAAVNTLVLTNNGTIAPGASPGALTLVNTAVTFGATGVLGMEIGGFGAGEYDTLTLSGTGAKLDLAAVGDTLQLSLWNLFEPDFFAGSVLLNLITAPTITGRFDNVILPTPALGSFQVQYAGGAVQLMYFPEPASGVLLALLGSTLVARRRR